MPSKVVDSEVKRSLKLLDYLLTKLYIHGERKRSEAFNGRVSLEVFFDNGLVVKGRLQDDSIIDSVPHDFKTEEEQMEENRKKIKVVS